MTIQPVETAPVHVELVQERSGRERPNFHDLPTLSAAHANRNTHWQRVTAPLQFLLHHSTLPDVALVALAAAAGPGGTQHLSCNRRISEALWCGVYAKTSGIGRTELVRSRVLSTRQRHHIVHVAAERSPFVLTHCVRLLTTADLHHLSGLRLNVRSQRAVDSELGSRERGEAQAKVRDDGHGVVILRHRPELRADTDPASWPVDEGSDPSILLVTDDPALHTRSPQAMGASVSEYLVSHLGEDAERWRRLAVGLAGLALGERNVPTWQETVSAAL